MELGYFLDMLDEYSVGSFLVSLPGIVLSSAILLDFACNWKKGMMEY
jgi:hypothetical protein